MSMKKDPIGPVEADPGAVSCRGEASAPISAVDRRIVSNLLVDIAFAGSRSFGLRPPVRKPGHSTRRSKCVACSAEEQVDSPEERVVACFAEQGLQPPVRCRARPP